MNKKYLVQLVFLVSLVSCFKDKGNYEYTTFDEIQFSGFEKLYYRAIGDTISIYPKFYVNGATPDTDNYEYSWIAWMPRQNYITISHDRELDKFQLSGIPEGDYDARFIVKDKLTNISYYQGFKLSIKNDLGQGFLIMTDKDSKMRLDLVNLFDNKFSYKRDILAATNSGLPEQTNPYFITTFSDLNSPGRAALWLLTAEGANRVHYTDFSYLPTYNFLNTGFGFPSDFRIEKMSTRSGGGLYIYEDGNVWLYERAQNVFFIYSVPINRYNNGPGVTPTKIKVSKHFDATSITSFITLFDEESKSFVYNDYQTSFISKYNTPLPENKLFEFTNTGVDLMWMSTVPRYDISNKSKTHTIALVKTPANNLHLYMFETAGGTQRSLTDMSSCPDLVDTPGLLVPNNINANQFLIFYVGGNKKDIYCYNLTYQTVKKVYSVSSPTEEITSAHYIDRVISPINGVRDNIGIATYDTATKEGKLVIKEYDSEGNFNTRIYNDQLLEWTFEGKPVSFVGKG